MDQLGSWGGKIDRTPQISRVGKLQVRVSRFGTDIPDTPGHPDPSVSMPTLWASNLWAPKPKPETDKKSDIRYR